jgi:ubiquinone/menaquinone biosynthesis C-methylase UbiE
MRNAYFADLELERGARMLEVGCGTGAVTRALAMLPAVESVIGVDPSPGFLAGARKLADGVPNVEFVEGDAEALPGCRRWTVSSRSSSAASRSRTSGAGTGRRRS